jgi:N-acetylmuramoyl-L-alanine amidase CwlA
MTTIDESKTAKGFTPAALVPAAFGQPRTLEGVVIHHWGLPGQTHDGVVDFFVNGPGETSAHFVVSAGRITCLVAPEDAAWHCPGKNATHIGIECRPEATAADYATVAELVAWLRATYALPLPLSKHRDWYNTACPGVWDLDRINALAGKASITAQSTGTAQALENIVATLNDAEKKKLMAAVDRILTYVDAPVSKVDEAVLDAKVTRADVGGQTSLRSTIAYLDTNLNAIREAKKAL